MIRTRSILFAAFLLVLVVGLGVAGYMTIERWSFQDSLYMTIITLTTVGFGEIHPLSDSGQIFTIVVLVLGLGVFGYLLGQATQIIVEGRLLHVMGRKKLERKIRALTNHLIICGYGRVGRIVCDEIKRIRPYPLVVIEQDPDVAKKIEEDGHLYISGDATDEDCLVRAGALAAKGLITALDSDAANVYITLTAKGLNQDLFVLARAGRIGTEKKLIRAGADRVVSPHQIAGFRMAQALLRPTVTEFIDFTMYDADIELTMEEIPVRPEGKLSNVTLVESGIRQQLDLIIVAIKKASGDMLFNPASHTHIETGDTLIALGQPKNLTKLAELLGNTTQ
jgi:voltage-gated potassium channel